MKKLISLLLCVSLIASSAALFAFAGANVYPAIVIPGLFQSEVLCYDSNGKVMLDSKGNERTGPFFMDTSEVVKDAFKEALLPLSKTLIAQNDEKNKFANALGDVLGKALIGRVKSDDNGNFVNDIRATKYNTSFANLSEYDREYILNAVPLDDYVEKVGADHLYFFSYSSFDNVERLAKQLTELIEIAKKESGMDKVNIVPISQGGSLWNAVMEYYPETANSVDRVIYIVPATDGSLLIGDIFANGFIDDDDALYDYMFPMLMGEDSWTGYLVNLLIRIFPKDVLNSVLDIAVDRLIGDYIANSTCIWGLIPTGSYKAARDKYLADDSKAAIRAQTDRYYQAQLNAKKNILAFKDKGVEFFDIVGYNHSLYPIVDSWKTVNADGIIQLESTSIGAVSAPVNGNLGADYKQQGNSFGTCSDPKHNHIDPHKMVDASTGLLPDHTFYFYNHNHERTADCDVIIKLAVRLLWDKSFKSVYSYPEEFPQFNTSRESKRLIKAVNLMKIADKNSLSEEDAKELDAAIAEVDSVLANTVVDSEAFSKAEQRFNAVTDKIIFKKTENKSKAENLKSFFESLLTKFFKSLNDFVNKFWGYRGFGFYKIVSSD